MQTLDPGIEWFTITFKPLQEDDREYTTCVLVFPNPLDATKKEAQVFFTERLDVETRNELLQLSDDAMVQSVYDIGRARLVAMHHMIVAENLDVLAH